MSFEEILCFIEEIQINDILIKFELDENDNKKITITKTKENFNNRK